MTTQEKKRLFQQGMEAGKKRDYRQAADIFFSLSQENDDNALLFLGRALHGLEDYSTAYQSLSLYLQKHPNDPNGFFHAGRSLLFLGEYRNALKHLLRSLDLGYSDDSVNFFLGISYLKLKRPFLAVEWLQKAVESQPDNPYFQSNYFDALWVKAVKIYHSADYNLARQMFEFLLQNGKSSSSIRFYLANCYKYTGQSEKAMDFYEDLLEEFPEDHSIGIQLGELYFAEGYTEDGNELLDRLEGAIPQIKGWRENPSQLSLMLPFQYFLQEDYRKAFHSAEEALKTHPEASSLHMVLGESIYRLGKPEDAMPHFFRAQELSPDEIEPSLGILECAWETDQFETFLLEFEKIKTRLSQDDQVYYSALIHCRLGKNPVEGVQLLGQAIEAKGIDSITLVEYPKQLLLAGSHKLAKKWLVKSLKAAPKHKELMDLYVNHFGAQDDGEALTLDMVESYLKANPTDDRIRFSLATRLLKAQKYTMAREELEKLLAKGYQNENLLRALAWSYRKEEDYKQAFMVYKKLLQKAKKQDIYLPLLVFCLIKLGNTNRAKKIAQDMLGRKKTQYSTLVELGKLMERAAQNELALSIWRKASEIKASDPIPLEGMSRVYGKMGKTNLATEFSAHADKLKK